MSGSDDEDEYREIVSNFGENLQQNRQGDFVAFILQKSQNERHDYYYTAAMRYLLDSMGHNNTDTTFINTLIKVSNIIAKQLTASSDIRDDELERVMTIFIGRVNAMIQGTRSANIEIPQNIIDGLDSVVRILQGGIANLQHKKAITTGRQQELTQLNQQLGALHSQLQNIQSVAVAQFLGPASSPSRHTRDLAAVGVPSDPRKDFAVLFADTGLWSQDPENTRRRALAFFQNGRLTDPNFTYMTGEGQIPNTPLTLASAIGDYAVETLIMAGRIPGATALDPNFEYTPLNMDEEEITAFSSSSSSSSSSSHQRNNSRDRVPSIPEGSMPLTIAIIKQKPGAVMLLLEIGAIVDDQALEAIKRSDLRLTEEELHTFNTYYGANRVQEDQELIDQAVQGQGISQADSVALLYMITQMPDPGVFAYIPRINDHQGLVSACQAIWSRRGRVFTNWGNYNLYKLLVTYYYAESHNLDKQLYPMRMSNYEPTSFLDNIRAPLFETKRKSRNSDSDEDNNSSSSSSSCNSISNSIRCSRSQRLNRPGSLSSSSSGQDGLLSSLAVAEGPSLTSSNSENTKKSRVSDGPGGNEPDRGPPAAQLQEPNWDNHDSVAQYLDFENFESINNKQQLDDRVKDLLRSPGGKTVSNIIKALRIITFHKNWNNDDDDDEVAGGKRRTMKVKKHFRKTKKRIYKKVKKTRMRRNNKSKRVLKGKKDKR